MIIDAHQHVFWHGRDDDGLIRDMVVRGIDTSWLLIWEVPRPEHYEYFQSTLNPVHTRSDGTHPGITLGDTLEACRSADAVLKAPIGHPEFDAADVRPEQGMLRLRAELDVYANLRPAREGAIDLLIVRELVGGLYFGAKGVRDDGTVFDTCEYHPNQVERIARRGLELARARRRKLTSVDKANVL